MDAGDGPILGADAPICGLTPPAGSRPQLLRVAASRLGWNASRVGCDVFLMALRADARSYYVSPLRGWYEWMCFSPAGSRPQLLRDAASRLNPSHFKLHTSHFTLHTSSFPLPPPHRFLSVTAMPAACMFKNTVSSSGFVVIALMYSGDGLGRRMLCPMINPPGRTSGSSFLR